MYVFRVNDAMKVKELISTARFARCRSRFVMPVILYENKVSMEYTCTVHYRPIHTIAMSCSTYVHVCKHMYNVTVTYLFYLISSHNC